MNILQSVAKSPALIVLLVAIIAGCSNSSGSNRGNSNSATPTELTISGTITGLATGASVVLQNNDDNDLTVTVNGSFIFSASVIPGTDYNVTVLTHPNNPSQTCTVSAGNGVAMQDITSVLVTCTTNTYSVNGSVAGLAGSGLVLQNNNGNDLSVSANGSFLFGSTVESGGSYSVTVSAQPNSPSQTCVVADGNGDVIDQDIHSIVITCTTNAYTVGGSVTGLTGSGLMLQNNSGDDLTISMNGNFSFSSSVVSGNNYNVAVTTQPTSQEQTCVVIDGAGVVADQNILSVVISCSSFNVGVTVTGLVSGESLTLRNNGGDDLVITENGGPFLFNTPIHNYLSYNVTISTQPSTSSQQCLVANGSDTVASADVLDIAIVCPNVTALYPTNGADWNDYVNNNGSNGFLADDTPCDGLGNGYASCLHGGEMRTLVLDGVTSCSGLTAEDELNAFNWSCDESTGSARIISTSLKEGAALSSLIDFYTSQWRENAVTINKSGSPAAKTPMITWWSNSIIIANMGGSLNSEAEIYIVTADPSANYIIDADKIGLVIQPGLEITGAGGGNSIHTNGYSYLWLEGKFNGSGNRNVILWENVTSSVLHTTQVRDVEFGGTGSIALLNCTNNMLRNIRIANSAGHGFVLNNSSYNTVSNIIAAHSGNAGVYLMNSNNNLLTGIVSSNNDDRSNAEGGGVLLAFSANNTIINATIVNNRQSGLVLANSPYNLLMNISGSNNYTSFFIVNGSNETTAINLVTADNSRHGIYLGDVSNNYFTGMIKIGNNADIDCRIESALTAPGLISPGCTDTGIDGSATYTGQLSDATLETGVTTSVSFIGKVLFDDVANTSDINGSATLAAITDWLNFENNYRSWGLDGDPYPAFNNKGPLPSCDNYGTTNEVDCLENDGTWRTDGRIWDWSLAFGDVGDNGAAVLHQVLVLPSGDDTITHSWSGLTSTKFLRNAIEVLGDAIGNDDGLCNSNEACIFTSNIGAYQGHGDLVSSGTFVDSLSEGISGVLLYQYETNGY